MLRFVDLQTRVKRLLDEAATSAVTDTTDALVEDSLNAAHKRLCLSRSWAFLKWPKTEEVSSTAGVSCMTLNPNLGRLLWVWDVAQGCYLSMIPMREWEALGVDKQAERPAGVVYGGYWPVMQQPTEATVLTIVSSSASDTSTRHVTVRGVNASGDVVEETLTANGVTAVTGDEEFVSILNITKIGAWVGTLSLKISATTILTLTTGEYAKQYPTLEFVEIPDASKEFVYAFCRIPRTLTQDNDIPEVPYPFSEILVYDALLELVTYRTDVNVAHIKMWSDLRTVLMKQLYEAQDELIVGARPRFVRDIEIRPVRFVN
jgi:hypothetical protein